MKYLKYITVVFFSLSFIACESELDLEPQQSVSVGVAITTADNVEAILVGAYDKARGNAAAASDDGSYDGDLANIAVLLGNTNQVNWNGTFDNLRDIYQKQMVNNNTSATTLYGDAYLSIGAVNTVLANLDKFEDQVRKDKVEGERVIPLTPYLAQLLYSLPRRNKWVFSSPQAKSGRLQDPYRNHANALIMVGLPPVTLHGLRRSFGSLSEWVECPVGIVAQIQGHKPSATAEKHYRVRPLDLLRLWHTKIEKQILDFGGVEQPELIKERLRVVE